MMYFTLLVINYCCTDGYFTSTPVQVSHLSLADVESSIIDSINLHPLDCTF